MTLGLAVLNLAGEWTLCKSEFGTSEAGREKLIFERRVRRVMCSLSLI